MRLAEHKSAVVPEVGRSSTRDRRTVRTGNKIDAAFVELIHRRSYGSLRVSDIIKKAGVGRATFYAHYPSKDALLASQFLRIVAPMLATRQHQLCPLDATAFFAHIMASPQIYRALMGPAAGAAPRILRECIEQLIRQALAGPEGEIPNEHAACDLQTRIVARYVASSLVTVIECSIENGECVSPQRLQSIFSKLVGGGLALVGARDPSKVTNRLRASAFSRSALPTPFRRSR
ncbi:MAG: helix-turn-helix domain-containing protein [Terriglobales bacterium]